MSCRAEVAGRLVPQISGRVQIVVGNQKRRPLGALVAPEERTPLPRSTTVVLVQVRRDQARDGNPVDRARHHFRSWRIFVAKVFGGFRRTVIPGR
jgi:hypothetical protein